MTISSSDLVLGRNVKWYSGGVATEETITITSGDVSAGYVDLTSNAEYGLVRATVDGVETALTHYQASGTTPATQTSGTGAFTYTGMTADDVVVVKYIAIAATGMTQVATSQGGSATISADTTSAAIDGQATKIKSVGAADISCTLNELDYNDTFIATVIGEQLTGDVAAAKKTWSNAFQGFNSIGALVGIEYNSSDAVVRKYAMVGITGDNVSLDFATEDYYKKSYSFQADWMIIADLS